MRPRTQESVAITADGDAWVLVNASPDIREQVDAFPPLHPQPPRRSPLAAIVLTSAELDHCLGLLALREAEALVVYATAAVREHFTHQNALYASLAQRTTWRRLVLGEEARVCGLDGRPTGLGIDARPVPGKVPRYREGVVRSSPEDVVALRIRDLATGAMTAYCPGAGRVDDAVRAALAGAGCVFFDGTFWSSDELVTGGLGSRRAEEMAHAPVGGPEGSVARLNGLRAGRRILTHLNNTNPLVREGGAEARQVAAAGWEVAYDGMEITG